VGGSGGGEKTVFVINYQYDMKKSMQRYFIAISRRSVNRIYKLNGQHSIRRVGISYVWVKG